MASRGNPSTPATEDGAGALPMAMHRAEQLDNALMAAINAPDYRPYNNSDRISASVAASSVALEHGRALRVLVADGLATSALSLLRLQHEALVRSAWLLYAASDLAVAKLSATLSPETAAAAGKLPMLSEMLKTLDGKAPASAMQGLLAFKDNNAAALNSFVHGGIHALHRHAQGFPIPLVIGALRNSNGLMMMTAAMLAVLSGNQQAMRRVALLQGEYAADLPTHLPIAPAVQPTSPTTSACADANQNNPNSRT